MTENHPQKPVEGTVVEQQTVSAVQDTPTPTTVVSKTTQTMAAEKGTNILAILGFVIGLGALFFYNIYAIPGIIGLVLASIGLSQINHSGEGGRGFANWGIFFSILSIVWVILQYLGVVATPGMLFEFLRSAFGFTA